MLYEKINRFVPDLERMGWRWYAALGCPLIATFEEPWDGWPRLLCGIGLGIALLLTALGLLRWLVIDPLRTELMKTHPEDVEIHMVPPPV